MELKKKAVKGAGVNIAGNFLGFLFHTFGVIILARLVLPKDFGLVAMVSAFSILPMNFGVNGFIGYIIQTENIIEEEINAIFWLHVSIAIFMAFCFSGFGLFLVYFYSEPALKGISFGISITFIFMALHTTPRALLWRDMKFSYVAFGDLLARIISVTIAITLAFYGMAYWAVLIRQIVSPLVTMIVSWCLCPWRPGYPHDLKRAIPGSKYALKIFGNETVNYFTKSIDRILLGKIYGSETLGLYDRASQLTSIPAGQLLRPLTSVAQATLSRLRDDKEKFTAFYLKAVSMVSFLGTAIAVFLVLSSDDLVPLLLGPGWSETARILKAFSPSIAAILLYGTLSWLHVSLGTPGRWLRWNILATILTIIAFIIAASFGAIALAFAYSASMYILVLPGLWYAGRPIQLSIPALLRCVGPYFIGGILTFFIWFFLPVYCPPINNLLMVLNLLCRIIFIGFVTSWTYILIVSIIQRDFSSLREVVGIFRLMLSRRKA